MNQISSSGVDREPTDKLQQVGRSIGGRAGLYLTGAMLLAATAAGFYYLGSLQSPEPAAPPQQQPSASASPASQPAAAPPLQWKTVGTFGSWEARCANPPGAKARLCTAVLQVMDTRTKGVLMAWIVGPDDKGAMQSVFQTPTGVILTNGVDVKLGNAAAHKIAYQSCVSQQCTAVAPMTDAFIKEVVGAPKADVTLTAINGQALNFGIPVAGLDKALAAIKK